ncbi:hypothetical protein [Brevundimonas fluminis]|jgi:hypothetical protein|uniref:hypothetical protein n=1 Tax=Brevundimonas fluminis TaxID=2487274 RepID=UPI000F658A9D|nr:hypothetical protein [Brevundimonas fluminis]
MRFVIVAAALAAFAAPALAQDPTDPNGDRRTHELNAEVAARLKAQDEAEARARADYQAAQARYEADMAAHRAAMARYEACVGGDQAACDAL